MSDQLDHIQERIDTVIDRVADANKSLESFKTAFELHVEKDDQMSSKLIGLHDTLIENTQNLREHMRRTDLLEEYVKAVDARFTPVEMERLRSRAVNAWISSKLGLVVKVGAALGAGATIGVALQKLLIYLQTH
jgi:chromosome segregation ATPase